MISKSSIDQIFETARVEEVIGDFVQLRKAGSNFKGLSPFTDEKTPSFMVSPVKQIWKDFSTGKGGSAVSFLMEHEHYTYPEALRYLAKKYQIEIEETEQSDEQKKQASERESMFIVSEFAKNFFRDTLLKNEEGKAIGLSYFRERGFTDATIEKFDLGYALDSWSHFTDAAIKKGYELKYLEKTGLTIVKGDKKFDRFKGRVLFPIHSMSGRVLGFGGRILTQDKKAAKYLNSPESDIYHKSKVLYGINQAKQAIAKEDVCYLVEGYTDVLSFHQNGVENVVASSGTALTPDQIRLISRLTQNIIVLFDGDAAGLRASIRGIDLILEQGMNVKVLSFPEGEDPDSYAQALGETALKEFLKRESKDFISFKVSLLMKEAESDPVKKAELIRDIVRSISKIPDSIKREVYVQECARVMDISESLLFNELAQMLSGNAQSETNRAKPSRNLKAVGGQFHETSEQAQDVKFDTGKALDLYEKEIIKLLLMFGNQSVTFTDWIEEHDDKGKLVLKTENYTHTVSQELFLQLQEDEMEFANPIFAKIYYELIEQINQDQNIASERLIHHSSPEISKTVSDLLMEDERYELSDWSRKEIVVSPREKHLAKAVSDSVMNLRRVLIQLKIEELMSNIQASEERESDMELIMRYTGLKNMIFERLNRVV